MTSLASIFLLSLTAGLGTGLGGLVAVVLKPGRRTFGFLMGATAGVMISLSFFGLMNEALALTGIWMATAGFGAGAFFMLVMDRTLPHIRFGEREARNGNPCIHAGDADAGCPGRHHHQRQFRHRNHITNRPLFISGALLAFGIAVHNLPEGIAIGAGYIHTPTFGWFIAAAIMLHNIPEGIATALPLCSSGMSKWDSFRVALVSGLVEPIGALIAALFLTSFEWFVPAALAFAGGVMMFITLDELIPVAREHGHQHYTAVGIILGSILVFLLSGVFGV